MTVRTQPHVVVRRNVVCQSSRNGAPILLAVMHATEGHNRPGVGDLEDLAAYFDQLSTQASSHVATDAEGNSSRMVPDAAKAWTVAGFNRVSLNIEQVGIGSEATWTPAQYRESARWLARWSLLHGLPLRKGRVSGATVTRMGVVRHSELGVIGGGHDDPGRGYSMRRLLVLARWYRWRMKRGKP